LVILSLAQTVQFLIENDPAIQDALSRNYANFSAIARLFKPKAEKILGRQVALEGLITAVKRIRNINSFKYKHQKVISESIINLRTDVAKISVEKTRKNLEKARLISTDFPEVFFHVLEGTSVLTLITDQRIFNKVSSVFTKDETLEEKQNLAAIVIQSPKDIVDTPGCIIAFYNPISRAHINIEETISCFTETIIVLQMENAARAFSLLTDQIASSRNILNINNKKEKI
jgi:hypothetical protein